MSARVLVTGSQGCIGAWVVKQLLERGDSVVCYDLDTRTTRLDAILPERDAQRLALLQGAIQDTQRLKEVVRGESITHIVHLAAVLMPYCQANPVEGGMIDVIGTLNVFEAARDSGRNIRVAYASSSAVWGPEDAYDKRALTEADPLKPATHYGVFKQANEGNARVFFSTNGISSFGLRPWTVYGPGRDVGLTADPTLAMQAIARGETFRIRVSGRMDLQFVGDVAGIFLACLFSPLEGAHVYNLAGDVIDMQDLIRLIDEVVPGAASQLSAEGPQVPVCSNLDNTALLQAIPRLPRTPLRSGIERTIQHYKQLYSC
jgi:nucleoside-diphosphate-sugar epimerase